MNFYGWRGSLAYLSQRRNTRTPGGALTSREYRLSTMLDEDGNVRAVGESDIIESTSGLRLRKEAQVTIPSKALVAADDMQAVAVSYFDYLDKAVESAVPRLLMDTD